MINPRLAASLEKSLELALKKANLTELLHFSKILKHWETIVGKPLSEKTRPALLTKKTLEVWVLEASYADHLKYFERQMLDLIASEAILGPNQVFRVRFKVGPVERVQPLLEKRLATEEKYRPPSQEAHQKATKKTERIQDPAVRRALRRFMARNLDRNQQ